MWMELSIIGLERWKLTTDRTNFLISTWKNQLDSSSGMHWLAVAAWCARIVATLPAFGKPRKAPSATDVPCCSVPKRFLTEIDPIDLCEFPNRSGRPVLRSKSVCSARLEEGAPRDDFS